MAATTLRAPDPSLLDTVPAGDPLNGRHHAALADEAGSLKEHDEEERHCKRFGPITLDTTDMQLLFKARQKFRISDKIRASVGAYYSFTDDKIGPTASITYMFNDRARIELTERRALAKRKWVWSRGNLSLGLGAECSITHTGLPPGTPRRPEVHLSLDHIKPLKYEIMGIGLVLLANLPFSLRDKEVEKPSIASRLLGFARATVKRTGYTRFCLDISELSGILEL